MEACVLHNQLCIVWRFSLLKWWIQFEFLEMSLAFDWLKSNVAKASCILSTTPCRVKQQAGLRREGLRVHLKCPCSVLQENQCPILASYGTKCLCPACTAENTWRSSPCLHSLSRTHTMAMGTEGRYLVVLVEAVGFAVPGLAVLMVAYVVTVGAGLSLVHTLPWLKALDRRSGFVCCCCCCCEWVGLLPGLRPLRKYVSIWPLPFTLTWPRHSKS